MLSTLHLDASLPADVRRAAALLQAGSLVAFATETVYGLGANAFSEAAVARIFTAKGRPSWDPLIVHIASAGQLGRVAEVPAALAERVARLAKAFWPGPLTLLLPRSAAIPNAVTAGRELVGVRIPAHAAAQALLAEAGLPLAAPSANLFGHTSPTSAAHVLADLDGRIEAVLDAGPTPIGVESTVLDPTRTPMILYRPGAVTATQVEAATGVAVERFAVEASAAEASEGARTVPLHAPLPSPGVGIRHYAPRARLVLVEGTEEDLRRALERQPREAAVGVLLPAGWKVGEGVAVERWALWGDAEALAATLFAGLRAMDDRGVGVIVCPVPGAGGIADAIRDRLEKAARAE